MKYLWKSLWLILDLIFIAAGALIFANGIFIISNVLGNTSFKPFFLYRLPISDTAGFGNFDWVIFSDLAISVICIAVGLAILYRAIIAFIENIQFFNSDFFVIRKGRMKLSPEEMTHRELMPGQVKEKGPLPKVKPQPPQKLTGKFPKFFKMKFKSEQTIKQSEESDKKAGLPAEPIIKPEAIGEKLNENVEILKQQPLETPPETPLDEVEIEPTKPLKAESAPFENFTSTLITPEDQLAAERKSKAEKVKEEVTKAKIEEAAKEKKPKFIDTESKFLGEVVAKTPEDEAKVEEEFLRSLNITSLWHLLWHRKHKTQKSPGKPETSKKEEILRMNIK